MTIDVDALKQSVDLVSLVGHYTPLKKRGKEYVGLCVAHADNNPSMWVNPDKGIVHCFACDFHADAIDFIRHVEGLDFKAACERLGAKPDWQPRIEAARPAPKPERITSKPPTDAPTPSFSLRALGEPQLIFPIRDLDSAILGYECRYAGEGGKKEIRVWTWGARGTDAPAWGCGHFNAPRPLYGLERLSERTEAPVSIFEGPKKAEAGKRLLPPYVCISWTGGANAWHKHDWKPIAGRNVLLWPDADEPGWTNCDKLKRLLGDPKGLACSVAVIDSNRMPDGWDVADAEEAGWDTLKLVEWAKPRKVVYDPSPAPESIPPAPAVEEPKPARKPKLAVVGNTALAPEPDAEALPAAMSDDALADSFADEHAKDWRYVAAWGRWYEWTGDRWLEDQTGKHRHLARMVTRQAVYWKDAAQLTPDGKRKINSARAAGSLLQFAQHDRRISAKVDQWDTDPWLLGVPGGVVDLRTSKTLEPVREQYITAQCAVAPVSGKPERWLEFLGRVTDNNADLIAFLHRCAGYWLTGSAREHSLTFLYGTGANGKSVFMRTLGGILGVDSSQYAASCQMTVFTESKMERHSTELARLRGARLVIAEETAGGAKWDQAKIQWLTGEGSVTARFMRMDDFTFKPQFKLLFAGNHKPMLRSVDEAIKRRFHLVPFTVTIPPEERDFGLYEKLRDEWPQILAWMIEGCAAWQSYGLAPPECVRDATDKYLETEDALGQWVEECCDRIEGTAESADLWRSYSEWCDRNGEHPWSRRSWANALVERGFPTKKGSGGRRMIHGLNPRVGANL